MYSRFQDQHVHVHILLFQISSLIDDKIWRVFVMSKVLHCILPTDVYNFSKRSQQNLLRRRKLRSNREFYS